MHPFILLDLNTSKKRVERIELSSLAWKAKVLPLNYTRKDNLLRNRLYLSTLFVNKNSLVNSLLQF